MGFIPEITCRRCGNKFSGLRNRCPKCGAPRTNQPTRVPPTTASVTPDTAASERSAVNVRWQFIFGGVLLIAVILAVVVLILTGNRGSSAPVTQPGSSGNNTNPGGSTGVAITDTYLPTPSPSPEPTPEASPTPAVLSIAIMFLNKVQTDMTISNEGELQVQLTATPYPNVEGAVVNWTSSNETVLTVDSTGLVTVVGAVPGQVIHATVVAECCGVQAFCTIYVPGRQATYLTENLYDPEYVDEWDKARAEEARAAAAATIVPSTSPSASPEA